MSYFINSKIPEGLPKIPRKATECRVLSALHRHPAGKPDISEVLLQAKWPTLVGAYLWFM